MIESSENIAFSLFKALYSYVKSFACLRSARKLRVLLVVAGLWMGGVGVWGQCDVITAGVTICQGGSGTLSASSCPSVDSATDGPRFAGNGTTGGSGAAWSNPGRVTANDNSYSSASLFSAFGNSGTTQVLSATQFGFSIPADATITGIQVIVGRLSSSNATVQDNQVQLIRNGTIVGNNLGLTSANWPATETPQTYGSANEMWGTSWTPAEINAGNFGVALAADISVPGWFTTGYANVDFIQVSVTYTLPVEISWYTAASGGTVVQTGSSFNPVGDAEVIAQGSIYADLTNTNTPGTYTFWAECASDPGCRTAAQFIILPLPVTTISGPTPVCSGTTGNIYTTESGMTGYTWSVSTGGTITAGQNTNQATITWSTAGSQTVSIRYTGTNGCTSSIVSYPVTVTAVPTATITYSGNPFCTSVSTPQNVTLSGTGAYAGGAYTSSPEGLTLDPVSGTITPSTSTPGTYTVTYTIPASGGCAAIPVTTNATITALPTATISYSGNPFCTSVIGPQDVSFSGTGAYTGGTFTSLPTGLTINSSTGAVTPSTSTPGVYTVTYTISASGGCDVVEVHTTVTITLLPAATISYTGNPFCTSVTTARQVTRTGSGGGTYSADPAGLSLNASTGAIIPSSSAPGTYTVTYTIPASGGCSEVIVTTNVTITAIPSATISYLGTPYCSDEGIISVTIIGTPGGVYSSSPSGLSINSSTGEINTGTSTPGNYQVFYDIAAGGGCAPFSTSTTLTISQLPVATFTYPEPAYCQNSTDPLPVFSGGGVAGTFSSLPAGLVFLSTSTGEVDLSASAPGTYNITNTIPASGGCPLVTYTDEITITALPTASISYPLDEYCNDAGIVDVILTGTSGGNYSANPAGLSIDPVTGNINTNTSTPGATYSITYRIPASGGCPEVSATTQVTINGVPLAETGPERSICTGATTQLGVSPVPGNTYLWTSVPEDPELDTDSSNPSVRPAETTTYTLTETTPSGCSRTNSVTVTANQIITVTVNTTSQSICPSTSTNITMSSNIIGTLFTWTAEIVTPPSGGTLSGFSDCSTSCGNSIIQTLNNTGSTSGVIRYTITAIADECANWLTTVDVTVFPAPATPTIDPDGPVIFCDGGSVTLTSSTGVSYLWSNGATTQSINAATSGSYTVTVTDANGCSATSLPTVVTVNPLPVVTISADGPTTFCQGEDVILTSSAGNSYLWSTGATTQSITVTSSGSYSVVLTDTNGCSATSDPVAVTVHPLPDVPVITPGGPVIFCEGGNVVLTSSPAASYLWNTGATTQSVIVNTTGSYSVTITDTNGCSSTSAVTEITVNPLPTALITPDGPTTFCVGDDVILTSAPGAAYLWSNSETTQSITVIASGTFSVTLTDANGCSASSQPISVTVHPRPVATITPGGPTTFCQGESVVLASSSASSYLWSNGATTQSVTISETGNYTVTITDGNGCTDISDPVGVTVNPLPPVPIITPDGPTTFCEGLSVTLGSSASTGNQWYLDGTIIPGATSQSYTASAAGTYSVTVTDANGCHSTSTGVIVTIIPRPVGSALPQAICSGSTTSIELNSNIPGTTFTWTAAQLSGGTVDGESSCATTCGTTIAQTLTNQTMGTRTSPGAGTPGVIRYTVVPVANGCTGLQFTVDATVNPIPYSYPITFHSQYDQRYLEICDGMDVYSENDLDVLYTFPPVVGSPNQFPAPFWLGLPYNNPPLTPQWQYSFAPTGQPWINIPAPGALTEYYQYDFPPVPPPSVFSPIGHYYFRFMLTNVYGCSSVSYTIDMEVTSTLTIEAGDPIIVCQSGNPAAIPLTNAMIGGTESNPSQDRGGTWSIASGGGTLSNYGFVPNNTNPYAIAQVTYTPEPLFTGTVTLVLTSVDPDGNGECQPLTDIRTIEVIQAPIINNPGTALECSGLPTNIVLTSSIPSTYSWTIGAITGGISGASPGSGPVINQILLNPGSTPGTVEYIVTPTPINPGSCNSIPASIIVTVNPRPETTGVTICPGGSGALSSTTVCSPSTGSSVASGSGGTSNSTSWGGSGNSDITIYLPSLPSGAVVTGTNITISYTSYGSSWRSELRVRVTSPLGIQQTIAPSTQNSPGSVSNVPLGTWGNNDPTGNWLFEFRETSNDWVNPDAAITNITITVNYTLPGSLDWYTVPSGGTPIGSGAEFSPVGVPGSGLPDTNTPGTWTYYLECSRLPGCRTSADFVISPPADCIITGASGVCPGSTDNIYTGPEGMSTYAWTISGNGTITGPANQRSVTVSSGNSCGTPITLLLAVTNPEGCNGSCETTVLVEDTEDPEISCRITEPQAVLVNTGNTYVHSGTGWDAGATDNCPVPPEITYLMTGSSAGSGTSLDGAVFNEGVTTVTWTATDLCDNQAICTFTVTVNGDADVAVTKTGSAEPAIAGQELVYTITVTNADNQSFAEDVVITDDVSGIFSSPEFAAMPGGPWSAWTGSYPVPGTIPVGESVSIYIRGIVQCEEITNTVTITSSNDNNPDNDEATLVTSVEDRGYPTFTYRPAPSALCSDDAGVYIHSGTSWDATADDYCGIESLTYELTGATMGTGSTLDGVTFNSGITNVTWTATDPSGNYITYGFCVAVSSIAGPDGVCPGSLNTYIAPAGMTAYTWSVTSPASIVGPNNGGSVQIRAPSSCTTYTVTLTTNSLCGSVMCSEEFGAVDNEAPEWVEDAGALDAALDCDDQTAIDAALAAEPTATDNCSDYTIEEVLPYTTTPGTCDGNYTITRTWTLVDECGNAAGNFTQTITVSDNEAPEWVEDAGALDAALDCDDQTAIDAALAAEPTATDNCSDYTIEEVLPYTTTPGTCDGNYTITRTWTLVDECGNAAGNFTQTITVSD
ncbi:MAG: PKD-like domain-containing protein, partial [Bacteroidales bacterium]|nr:PKD-like domain-containing protein [Bacteroidales bacterium]